MFCKWCGTTLAATDRNCPACGRETPPMSDCGGFYDLKHSLNLIPLSSPPPSLDSEPKSNPDAVPQKTTNLLSLIMGIAAAALLVLVLILSITLLRLNGQINTLNKQIENLKSENSIINQGHETSSSIDIAESEGAELDAAR